jgi:hypothetical protein
MNSINDSSETAKNPTDPALPDEKRTSALLETISAHLSSLALRFNLIEKRLAHIERHVHRSNGADVPAGEEDSLPEPSSEPVSPPYALRCDGRVLLSTDHLEGVDLSGRETFNGVVLDEAEISDALDRVADAFVEAAAYSVGWLRKVKKGVGGKEP